MGNGDVSKCKKVKTYLGANMHGEDVREPSAPLPSTFEAEEILSMRLEGAFEKHKPGGGKVVGREVTRRPCAPLLVRASKWYSTGAKRLLRRAHYGAARQEHRERVPRSVATAVVRARGHADIEGAKEQVQCTSCSRRARDNPARTKAEHGCIRG